MEETKGLARFRNESKPPAPATGGDDPVRPSTDAAKLTDQKVETAVKSQRATTSAVSEEDSTRKKGQRLKSCKKKPIPQSSSGSSSEEDSSDSDDSSDESDLGEDVAKSRKKTKKPAKKRKTLGRKKKSSLKTKSSSSDGNQSTSLDVNSSDTEDLGANGNSDDSDDSVRDGDKERLASLEAKISQLQLQLGRNTQNPTSVGSHPWLTVYGGQPPLGPSFQPTLPNVHFPPNLPQTSLPPPAPPSSGRPVPPPPGWRGPRRRSVTPGEAPPPATSQVKGKKPTKPDFKRVDWVWDSSLYSFKLQDTAETAKDSHYDGYIFHVRRTFDCEGKYRRTLVDIKSKLLRECLQDVIGNVKGVSLVDETPKMDPNMLFLYVEDLRIHLKDLKHLTPAGETKKERRKNQRRLDDKRKHLKILIRYIDIDYAKIKDSLYPMLKNGLITYDLLWALWKPGTVVYSTTYGSVDLPRAFKVEMADRQVTMSKGDFYYIDGKYFEFDGKRFGHGHVAEEIPEFRGARKITSLSCYPLEYHKDQVQLRDDLIERGKKFVSLSGVHYKAYTGMAFMKRRKSIIRFNIQNSRIMVDPSIFRRINPNYYVSVVRSKRHDAMSFGQSNESSDDDSEDCGCGDSSDSGSEQRIKYIFRLATDRDGKTHVVQVPKDQEDGLPTPVELSAIPSKQGTPPGTSEEGEADDAQATSESAIKEAEFADEDYLIASPVVLGFSFSEKQWLEFAVSSINEIKWNEDAWPSLVLEPSTKDLIQALVESRKFHAANTIDDVIQGKGKGLVTVLHGPPGTGKTLTAEGISELLKCPLYMASAGELGTDSRILEGELQKILDICHAWGAILLLDEADVFLEKRNMQDIHRNALVSIFLRQLEYFQGILFLTTNRVETFDEAFQSRIHIALRYDSLDAKAKKAIFKMFIDRVKAHGKIKIQTFEDAELDILAKNDLNGREIKNVLGSAQDLAMNKGEALGMKHIRQVLDVHAKFGRDLKGGTGYEDAMRSYF